MPTIGRECSFAVRSRTECIPRERVGLNERGAGSWRTSPDIEMTKFVLGGMISLFSRSRHAGSLIQRRSLWKYNDVTERSAGLMDTGWI